MKDFKKWLEQKRSQGEQFSGPQLVTLVEAITKAPQDFSPKAHQVQLDAVFVLLKYLEQYVTGVTCEEVKHVLSMVNKKQLVSRPPPEDIRLRTYKPERTALEVLKPNIVDGQNKVGLVAFSGNLVGTYASEIEGALRDVGVGLPPKNNPIFGKGGGMMDMMKGMMSSMWGGGKGRNIPVNTIAFITPEDLATKQFAKGLAQKTGGFFRAIEQTDGQLESGPTESDMREPTEHDSGNP